MAGASPRAKKSYHHGNLRHDLVAAALEIINRSGPEGLTLRAVAKRLGVTPTAPYRHFASKKALLAAVATDGFTALLEEVRAATEGAGPDPRARFAAIAVGYLRFATAHPGHFRVMYGPQVDFHDVAVFERRAAFEMLTDSIEACQAAGLAVPGSARAIANRTWAYAHGLVTLHLHGLLHPSIDGRALLEMAREIQIFLDSPAPPVPSLHGVAKGREGSPRQGRGK